MYLPYFCSACYANITIFVFGLSVPCATDRLIGLPELRHCKRHFQTDPDVKFRKPNCWCAAPECRKHGTEENGRHQSFAVFLGPTFIIRVSPGLYRPFSHCIDQAGLGAFTAKSGRRHYNPPPLTVMWMNSDSPNFLSFCSLGQKKKIVWLPSTAFFREGRSVGFFFFPLPSTRKYKIEHKETTSQTSHLLFIFRVRVQARKLHVWHWTMPTHPPSLACQYSSTDR